MLDHKRDGDEQSRSQDMFQKQAHELQGPKSQYILDTDITEYRKSPPHSVSDRTLHSPRVPSNAKPAAGPGRSQKKKGRG